MEQKKSKFELAKEAYEVFASEFNTLQMATVDVKGKPNASYSPYVKYNDDYFIYVSELSEHTANLSMTHCASIFFVENEADASHIYARRRLTYHCYALEVDRGKDLFDQVMDLLGAKFGDKFINMIRGLEDFHLFKLNPESGTFVNGFAQAFETTGKGMCDLVHKNDVGHRSTNKETEEQMTASADY